jgi:hypothetical protein
MALQDRHQTMSAFFLEVLLVLGKKTLPDELLIVAYTNSALLSTLLAILAS